MIDSCHVFIKVIQAEMFFNTEGELPKIQIATNLEVKNIKKVDSTNAIASFMFTVNYSPSVASIVFKGECNITADKQQIEKLMKTSKPAPKILQRISTAVFLDSFLCCRILNVPPPIPLPQIK